MSQRETLVKLIENVDREIEKLQKQRSMYQNALMLESGGTVDIAMISAPGKGFMEMAREVVSSKALNPEQQPLHAKKIGELVQTEFKVPVDIKSLSQMLYANAKVAKKTRYFYKDKKSDNTYGLLAWQK